MEKFYKIKEVAEILKVHWKTIYRWINEKRINAKKIGRDWKIAESEIIYINEFGLRNQGNGD